MGPWVLDEKVSASQSAGASAYGRARLSIYLSFRGRASMGVDRRSADVGAGICTHACARSDRWTPGHGGCMYSFWYVGTLRVGSERYSARGLECRVPSRVCTQVLDRAGGLSEARA